MCTNFADPGAFRHRHPQGVVIIDKAMEVADAVIISDDLRLLKIKP